MRKRLIKKSPFWACAIVLLTVAVNSVAAQSNWTAFWQKFKTAVVNGDQQCVLSLSQDSLSDADYKALFGTKSKKQCFAKAKAFKDERGGYSVFCGEQGYYFEIVNGQFKFTGSFADD